MRSHPAPEASGNTIGLEAIIRKALMGKYDEQMDDRSPSNSVNSINAGVPAAVVPPASADGRSEDPYSLPGVPNKPLIIHLPSWQHVSGFDTFLGPNVLTKKDNKVLTAHC